MPVSTTVTGMVLSAMPVGEYDKRLVILTKEIGKVSAFAKGARRPNSALLACSQPFSFGEFSLYAGKSAYNIISAEMSNYFGELRDDFNSLCYGFYFCEFAGYITKENIDEKNILKLLYQTLRAITKKSIDIQLIRAVFELKIMSLNGETPQVFGCVKCDKQTQKSNVEENGLRFDKYYFSAESGGILCAACKGFDKNAISINTSTLYTMQYIISKEIEKLYTFKVTDEVLKEIKKCIKCYLNCYIDHEFKSLEILNGI
ncbi:MAG: DNA repair protein RecO [Herbinix sp.]|nr:DNA repair protein RecO [Herbinix sp.]